MTEKKMIKNLNKDNHILMAKKQNNVRTQLHKSETRGNTKFSGTFAAPHYETFVFVPFTRIINFTGVFLEMLLNRILFTFTRKMETNWLSARLVNFPLSFFHGYKLESQLAFLFSNLKSVLQILDKGHMIMNIRCSLKVPLCHTNSWPSAALPPTLPPPMTGGVCGFPLHTSVGLSVGLSDGRQGFRLGDLSCVRSKLWYFQSESQFHGKTAARAPSARAQATHAHTCPCH